MNMKKWESKKRMNKWIAVGAAFSFLFLWSLPHIQAEPPEGKGSERAHEVAAGKGNGNGNAHANNESSIQSARKNSIDRMLSRQAGGKNFYVRKAGDFEWRGSSVPSQEENDTKYRPSNGKTGGENSLKQKNRLLVNDFEQALGKLRKYERARWGDHPRDTRGQGNMGKVDMLDPYGFARDDRKELFGNRGRVIHPEETPPPPSEDPPPPPPDEEPPPPPTEDPPPPPDTTQQILVSSETVEILRFAQWYGTETTTQLLMSNLGYTYEEATYLQSLSLDLVTGALIDGFIVWTP